MPIPTNDPTRDFFTSLLNGTPTLAAFLFCVYLIGKWFGSYMDKAEKRDAEREIRYNALVDSQLKLSNDSVRVVTEALTSNTEVLRQVKERLDASAH